MSTKPDSVARLRDAASWALAFTGIATLALGAGLCWASNKVQPK